MLMSTKNYSTPAFKQEQACILSNLPVMHGPELVLNTKSILLLVKRCNTQKPNAYIPQFLFNLLCFTCLIY